MNYHIFPANIFFETYIEDIYNLHLEDENVFWVRGEKNGNAYLNTLRPLIYIGNDEAPIISLLHTVKPTDRLFVSWYDIFIGKCILKSQIECKLYVYLMGGDFYCDPPGYHDNWLYDRQTRKVVKRLSLAQIKIRYNPRNWHKTFNEIHTYLKNKHSITSHYNEKLETIKRIDYIITTPNNTSELNLIKKLYTTFHAQHKNGVFEQNVDLTQKIPLNLSIHQSCSSVKILLGNSATAENNHIDAYNFIKDTIHQAYDIYVPLSYGDDNYSKILQKKTTKELGGRFHPITQYMKKQDYINLINSMDIVVMYHNRQQAYGNIITSLMLGKPVFMKKTNAAYTTLKSFGIPGLFDTNSLIDGDIDELIRSAHNNIKETQKILIDIFSKQQRIQYLLQLLK